jgi:hypothetical protein
MRRIGHAWPPEFDAIVGGNVGCRRIVHNKEEAAAMTRSAIGLDARATPDEAME